MSRISKIFNSNSDSEDSDYSDISESSRDDNEEDFDDNDEELDSLEELDDDSLEELDDDKNEEDLYNEKEDDKYEEKDNEEDNEEKEDSDEDSSDEDNEHDAEEELEYDDYDDFEETGLLLENDDYTDSKTVNFNKKSKTIKNAIDLENYKSKKKEIQLEDIRVPSIKFLEKLLKNKTNAERLERSVYNHIIRFFKTKDIKLTLKSKEFRQSYSKEIYSIMSLLKSMSFLQVKACFDNDVEYFSRGSFKNEKIQDEKKLKLITHVSEPVAGIHKCKCGCDKVYSYELQLRSGDEGMTVFLQCSSCGRKWRT
jgi:DNA-directed RNA polymerase subunit M/transcription elongation factor TFIIS